LINRMGIVVGVLMLVIANFANGQTAGSGVAGTAHDPGIWSFGFETQVCIMCHAPHNTSTQGPLWNHEMSAAAYTLYGSSTLNATPGQPGRVSKLCLSCHDGTVGILNYGGLTGGMTLAEAYSCTNPLGCRSVLGTNLSNDHPIGIVYDGALAAADGGLADPAAKTVTIGSSTSKSGTIAALMLVGGKVECTSCHDVHNIYTVVNGGGGASAGFVKVSMAGSLLCRQCHDK